MKLNKIVNSTGKIKLLKDFLFTRKGKSSLNLFLILPIFICFSLGCLCSGSSDYQSCITSDGETLVLAQSKLHTIRYTDGTILSSGKGGYTDVLCSDNNEVIAIDKKTSDSKRGYDERKAIWHASSKTYQFAPDEFWEKYIGFIQNRYFVSSSRGYITKSRTSGSGKNSKTVYYNVYTQPQVFSLEDSTDGKVKSHHITREKLGLSESVYYDDLRFYPLTLSENGLQLFAFINNSDRTVSIYQIDMFTGMLNQIGNQNKLPEKQFDENITFEKKGNFVAYVLSHINEKGGMTKNINVLNLEKNEIILRKEISDVSFSDGTPKFVFDESGEKLALIIQGSKYEPKLRSINYLTVFELNSGNEIASFDIKELLEDPKNIESIYFKNDDFLIAHMHKPDRTVFTEKKYICKLNVQTKQIIWNVELPE